MIVHVEYRCPECEKVFNCPANLASHRRWHKPRNRVGSSSSMSGKANNSASNANEGDASNSCSKCGKHFKKVTSLKKHLQMHNCDSTTDEVNIVMASSGNNNNNNNTSVINSNDSISELLSPSKEDNNNIFPCRFCPESFSGLLHLTRHVAKRHYNPSASAALKALPYTQQALLPSPS